MALQQYLLEPQESLLKTLVVRFTLAVCWEGAGDRNKAWGYYNACSSDKALREPAAQFDNRSIRDLLPEALRRTRPRTGKRGEAASPEAYTFWKVVFDGKPGIGPRLEPTKPPKPYTDAEVLLLANRCLPPGAERQAEQLVKDALEATRDPVLTLRYATLARPGMVLLGIGGTEADLQQLGDALVRESDALRKNYFDETGAAPLLYVYANFTRDRDDEIGRRLSRAIHLREYANTEGYYLPLDHSLMLRRGLVGRQSGRTGRTSLYLGTGLHELVHSLIHIDFPEAPLWLNEGLAALHEEQEDGRPLDNYRLYIVKEAIGAGRLPSLASLLEYSPADYIKKQKANGASQIRGAPVAANSLGSVEAQAFFPIAFQQGKPIQRPPKNAGNPATQSARPGEANRDDKHGPADSHLLYIAHARYFCKFLLERSKDGDTLGQAYQRLRSLGKGCTSSQVEITLREVTGLSLEALDQEFARYAGTRDTAEADRRWSSLKADAEEYIRALGSNR